MPHKNKLVVVPPSGSTPPDVTQKDLEELIYLRRRTIEWREAYLKKKDSIRQAIEAGSEVQEGVHTAEVTQELIVR